MTSTIVCPLQELPDGTMKSFRVNGRDLLLVRNGTYVYALRDLCPHQGAALSAGVLTCGRCPGGVGQYDIDRPNRIVRCPWHNWEFDAANGTSMHEPQRVRVARYHVQITDGLICVEI